MLIYTYIYVFIKVVHFCAKNKINFIGAKNKINFIGFLKYVLLMYTEQNKYIWIILAKQLLISVTWSICYGSLHMAHMLSALWITAFIHTSLKMHMNEWMNWHWCPKQFLNAYIFHIKLQGKWLGGHCWGYHPATISPCGHTFQQYFHSLSQKLTKLIRIDSLWIWH